MNRRIPSVAIVILLSFSLSLAGQSASKLVKMGDQAVKMGNHYSAAVHYLDSLAKKPKSAKTQKKLAQAALQGYNQKLKLSEDYRNNGNLEGALREYQELERFVERLRARNVLNFATVDFRNILSLVSESAAEQRYQSAEGLFGGRNYPRAIAEYKATLALKNPYKDCREKISESYYQIGVEAEHSNAYRRAAENYMESCSATPNYKDAKTKAASIYCALGDHFFKTGDFRNAYEDFRKAQSINADAGDIGSKLALAKDRATIRIAFARFDNATGRNIAGMALGDVIMESIKSRAQAGGSQFIRVLDRDELYALAQEQRISEGMINETANTPLKLEGVDYLVFGKLNQVREVMPGRTVERLGAPYEYSIEIPYTDSKGRRKTRTEWREAPMSFDLVKDSYSLYLGGTVKVISVKSGAIAVNKQISENGEDRIAYAANVRLSTRHTLDSVIIDSDVAKLLEARRELVDIGEIVNKIILSISNAMSSSILATIDSVPRASDPVSLKY